MASHLPFDSSLKFVDFKENPSSPFGPIAIISPHTRNIAEQGNAVIFTKELHEMFGKDAPSIKIISPQNSTAALYSDVLEKLQEKQYSAIVTFDAWSAHILSAAYQHRDFGIPFLFTNMHDVSTLEALNRSHAAHENVSGISVKHPSYKGALDIIKDWYSSVRRAHLIVHPDHVARYGSSLTHGLTRENYELFHRKGIELRVLNARNTDGLAQALYQRVRSEVDIIVTGDDNMALSHAELIGDIANLRHVPVLTQSLEMVRAGHAAIGCGSWSNFTLGMIVERLRSILCHGRKPSSLPLTTVNEDDEVRVNPNSLEIQGMNPSPSEHRAMRVRTIFSKDDGYQPVL